MTGPAQTDICLAVPRPKLLDAVALFLVVPRALRDALSTWAREVRRERAALVRDILQDAVDARAASKRTPPTD